MLFFLIFKASVWNKSWATVATAKHWWDPLISQIGLKGSCVCKRSWKMNSSPTNRGSSFPQKTLLLNCCVSSPAFNSVTLWHHKVTHNLDLVANLVRKNWFSTALVLLVVLTQACMSWPIRANWVSRGRGVLKRQELQSCSTGLYEETDVNLF